MTREGILLHAKYAFMPNNLGYCGPDDRGNILHHLEEGKSGEKLVGTLQEFEAAYPFLKLIARTTGRQVFDYSVPEAYWIGNSLLDRVPVTDFYSFSHRDLRGRNPGRVHEDFRELGGKGKPHHTFYVMSTYVGSGVASGPGLGTESERKLGQLIDNCRISWGEVEKVGKKELKVTFRPVVIEGGRLRLASARLKTVQYNPDVKPFQSVKKGDVVSLHWNYACDVLTRKQLQNMAKYTSEDLVLANRLVSAAARRR
jgi:hypothetical protein